MILFIQHRPQLAYGEVAESTVIGFLWLPLTALGLAASACCLAGALPLLAMTFFPGLALDFLAVGDTLVSSDLRFYNSQENNIYKQE